MSKASALTDGEIKTILTVWLVTFLWLSILSVYVVEAADRLGALDEACGVEQVEGER